MIYKPTNRTGRSLYVLNDLVKIGLGACWVPLGSGNTLIDISGHNFSVALSGGQSWSLGRNNRRKAMYCNGTGTGIETGYSLPATNPFTVIVRLRIDPGAVGSATGRNVWTQELGGNDIGLILNGTTGFTYTNLGAATDGTGPAGALSTDWVDWAVADQRSADVDDNTYYINGAPATGGANNAALPANTTFIVGARSSTNPFFGWIEHLFVIERALNTSELAFVTNPAFDLFLSYPRRSYSIPVTGGKPDLYYRMMRQNR